MTGVQGKPDVYDSAAGTHERWMQSEGINSILNHVSNFLS